MFMNTCGNEILGEILERESKNGKPIYVVKDGKTYVVDLQNPLSKREVREIGFKIENGEISEHMIFIIDNRKHWNVATYSYCNKNTIVNENDGVKWVDNIADATDCGYVNKHIDNTDVFYDNVENIEFYDTIELPYKIGDKVSFTPQTLTNITYEGRIVDFVVLSLGKSQYKIVAKIERENDLISTANIEKVFPLKESKVFNAFELIEHAKENSLFNKPFIAVKHDNEDVSDLVYVAESGLIKWYVNGDYLTQGHIVNFAFKEYDEKSCKLDSIKNTIEAIQQDKNVYCKTDDKVTYYFNGIDLENDVFSVNTKDLLEGQWFAF